MSEHSGDAPYGVDFSRIIRVEHVGAREGEEGESLSFAADDNERRMLAKRFGLVALDALEAEVVATRLEVEGDVRQAPSGVRLRVKLEADVVQSCVVSLEPVAAHIAQGFEVDYLPAGATRPESSLEFDAEGWSTESRDGDAHGLSGDDLSEGEVIVDVDEVDPPEVLEGGEVDVGEVIAEYLSLALDPYPRAPAAEIAADQTGYLSNGDLNDADTGKRNDEVAADNPFAVLKKLKTND